MYSRTRRRTLRKVWNIAQVIFWCVLIGGCFFGLKSCDDEVARYQAERDHTPMAVRCQIEGEWQTLRGYRIMITDGGTTIYHNPTSRERTLLSGGVPCVWVYGQELPE